jgi:hypothetical protein
MKVLALLLLAISGISGLKISKQNNYVHISQIDKLVLNDPTQAPIIQTPPPIQSTTQNKVESKTNMISPTIVPKLCNK